MICEAAMTTKPNNQCPATGDNCYIRLQPEQGGGEL